jgi:hypothetical protein
MALPLIAAGIAARAVAKKLASRAAGGITGAGAKQVNTVYRNMGTGSVKVKPAQSTDTKINQGLAKMQRDAANKMVANRKSGGEARLEKYMAEPNSARGAISTAKKIKINSNPTRSR